MTMVAVLIFVICLAVMFWAHLASIKESQRIRRSFQFDMEASRRIAEARKRLQEESWKQGAVPAHKPLPMVPDYPLQDLIKASSVGLSEKPKKKKKPRKRTRRT